MPYWGIDFFLSSIKRDFIIAHVFIKMLSADKLLDHGVHKDIIVGGLFGTIW